MCVYADHLSANWSQMQANKATPEVMKELRTCLENPKTSAGAGFEGARDDLRWLNRQKDLSSIALGEKALPGAKEQGGSRRGSEKSGGGGGGGGVGGLVALFNCAGKRK